MNVDTETVVAVIGAGTMGSNIAGEFARAGCRVKLLDVDSDRLLAGLVILKNGQRSLIDAGLMTAEQAEAALTLIETTTELDVACSDCDVLIEAVSENLGVKKELFARFDRLCPESAVLASNTSGLSITEIASATNRPDRIGGMHFWNPPHIIRLVEVIKGKYTDDRTASFLIDLCTRIGKRPILVNHDIPGFVGNRLQFAVLREALHLISEGVASAEDVDAAMTDGPGLRYGLLGPLRTADLGGLDIFHAISTYLFAELSDAREAPALLTELVNSNSLGAKTGSGFYEYEKSELDEIVAKRDRVLLGFLKVLEKELEE